MKTNLPCRTYSKKIKKSLAQIEELFQRGLLSVEDYERRKVQTVNENITD
jgi:hypothetical protein